MLDTADPLVDGVEVKIAGQLLIPPAIQHQSQDLFLGPQYGR